MVKRTGMIQMSVLLPEDLAKRIDKLSKQTRVPKAAYLREGVEYILQRYEKSKKTRNVAN